MRIGIHAIGNYAPKGHQQPAIDRINRRENEPNPALDTPRTTGLCHGQLTQQKPHRTTRENQHINSGRSTDHTHGTRVFSVPGDDLGQDPNPQGDHASTQATADPGRDRDPHCLVGVALRATGTHRHCPVFRWPASQT
ncbi:hypothetical protein Atai01_56900 [Amycolatopsis taiwanensis]|uniref:Uncharacterized protein n=1 Tax=Amycolatopsis taiwanensis TaxID=342230 RepID=A0A9W6R3Z2_9PSEU|nr:hypothetical protein Atai01_56900 [Amycolatopsis taiwanensis]